MAGGPLRIDSRPSRWSVTRETERESWGKSWRGSEDPQSLFARQRPRIGLPRISGKEEDKRRGGKEQGKGEEGGRVVERWKVEKRRQ